jgi:tripartite-type tricarboxylate transporter receptor subunit TctC
MKKATETKPFKDYIKNNVAQEYILSTTDFQKFLETQEGLYRDMLASLAKK